MEISLPSHTRHHMQSILRFVAFLIAVLTTTVPAVAAATPDTPTISKFVKRIDESASSKSTPTAINPARTTVRGLPSGPNVSSAETEPKEEAINSRWTMYFTGGTVVVGLLQGGLFFWQLRLMRSSVEDTATAAKAAELSSRAAVAIELPVLRLIPTELLTTDALISDDEPFGANITDDRPEKFSAIGAITINNHGRTPAFPDTFSIGYCVANRLPDEPTYARTWTLNHAAVIKPDGDFDTEQCFGFELTDAEVEAAGSGNAWLWVFGFIRYTDFLGTKQTTRFCWRYANRNYDTVFYHFASDGEPPLAYIR